MYRAADSAVQQRIAVGEAAVAAAAAAEGAERLQAAGMPMCVQQAAALLPCTLSAATAAAAGPTGGHSCAVAAWRVRTHACVHLVQLQMQDSKVVGMGRISAKYQPLGTATRDTRMLLDPAGSLYGVHHELIQASACCTFRAAARAAAPLGPFPD